MKNLNKTKSLFLLIGLACLTTFFITCKNPTDDLQVTASADFVSAASEFRIFDATTGQPEAAFEGVTIKVSGPAAPFIYSSGGKKAIVINNGIVQVCFRRGTVVSEAMPLKFNLEISVSGYITKIYPVSLTSLAPVTQTIFVVNTNNLPKGTAKISSSTTTDNTGTTTSETIVTLPTNANKTEVAELTIPAGVTMKDKDGNPVTGTVAIDVLQFAGSGQQALDAFGNKGDNTIKDINGNALTESVIAPLGWLNINMTAGGKEVKTFSSPVKSKIGIPAGLVNPLTGAEYKEGDAISVLSKEDDGTEFKKESTATLQKATDGSLFAEINITHLSTWTIAQILEMCGMKIEFPVNTAEDQLTGFSSFASLNFKYSYYKVNGDLWYEEVNPFFLIIFLETSKYIYVTDKVTVTIPIKNFGPVKLSSQDAILNIYSSKPSFDFDFSTKNYRFGNLASNTINNPCSAGAIVSGPATALSTTKAKFRAKCTSGLTNYATLPADFKLYYIKNSDFLATGSPGLTNAAWKSTTLDVEGAFNTCTINKADLAGGGELRTAILYDGKRYEYIQNIPAVVPDELTIELSIPCN